MRLSGFVTVCLTALSETGVSVTLRCNIINIVFFAFCF